MNSYDFTPIVVAAIVQLAKQTGARAGQWLRDDDVARIPVTVLLSPLGAARLISLLGDGVLGVQVGFAPPQLRPVPPRGH